MITKRFKDFKKIYESKQNTEIELNTLLWKAINMDSYSSGIVYSLCEDFNSDIENDMQEFYSGAEINRVLFPEDNIDIFTSPKLIADEVMKQINLRSKELLECIDIDSIESIELSDYSSPREYNFTTDSSLVTLKVKEGFVDELISKIRENEEDFSTYIKERYSSRSGFISFTANEIEAFIEKLKENEEREIAGAVSFLTDEGCVDDLVEQVIEDIRGNSSAYEYFTEEDNKEINKRDKLVENIKNKAKEYYTEDVETAKEELVKYAIEINDTSLDFDEDEWSPIIDLIVKHVWKSIDDKTGKLDI